MRDPICKISTPKSAGGMTLVVEHLPSKPDTLNSNPSTVPPPPKKNQESVPYKKQVWEIMAENFWNLAKNTNLQI
jgi:hypothetical protein